MRKINDKEVFVVSHFRIKNSSFGLCITNESDEHKKAKILIATLVENKEIILKIGNSTIPYSALNIKNVPEIPFRWEQNRENRRADVLFEFYEWHPVLGQGIVFEVQTYQLPEEDKTKREFDWICNGYSLAWLPIDLFQDLSLTQNEILINNPWALKFAKINSELTKYTKDLLFELTNEKEKYEDRKIKTCRTCIQSSIDKDNSELLACWYNTKWGKTSTSKGFMEYPSKHEPLDTCENHKSRSW